MNAIRRPRTKAVERQLVNDYNNDLAVKIFASDTNDTGSLDGSDEESQNPSQDFNEDIHVLEVASKTSHQVEPAIQKKPRDGDDPKLTQVRKRIRDQHQQDQDALQAEPDNDGQELSPTSKLTCRIFQDGRPKDVLPMVLSESHRREILDHGRLIADSPEEFNKYFKTWGDSKRMFSFQAQACTNIVELLSTVKETQEKKIKEERERKEIEREQRLTATFGDELLKFTVTDAPFQ